MKYNHIVKEDLNKMMMRKNKFLIIISAIISITIITFIALYLWVGYIPFLGEIFVKSNLKQYTDNQVENTRFDWLEAEYHCVLSDGSELRFDLKNRFVFDEEVSSEYNKKANRQYQSILENFSSSYRMPSDIHVWSKTKIGDSNIVVQKAYILTIYNTEKLSEKESLDKPSEIAQLFMELMGDDFNFTNFQIGYADLNGFYELRSSNNGLKTLSLEGMKKNTRKYQTDELPHDYKEWMDTQK